eukprot:TRINITY_DN545_c0_g1_i4.p1 TRINITY_DN545_c0_g1~~TRINITY_DN545_c0_g1_i4.p1  ORF type:complete len:506 (-),score=79.45 TRINITY_DN545_c0_g1_i4:194-1711(-)
MEVALEHQKARMRSLEVLKHYVLLALVDTSSDFDEYYLYFMIPLGYGCNNINYVFAALNVLKSIFSFVFNILCAYLVDATENYQHIALRACASLVLLSALALMYFGTFVSVPTLSILFVIHLFAATHIKTLLWKVIKMRTQLVYGKENVEDQEETISRVGTNSAIVSHFYELFVLISTYIIAEKSYSYSWAISWFAGNTIFSDIAIIFLSVTYSKESIYCDNLNPSVQECDVTTIQVAKGEEQPILNLVCTPSNKEAIIQFLRSGLIGIKARIQYLWEANTALHALVQSLLFCAFGAIAEYPLKFFLSEAEHEYHSVVDSSASVSPTLNNFCSHKLLNLVLLAVFDNIAYAVGSVVYFLLFVNMPPSSWFRFAYPLIGGATLGLVLSLLFLDGVAAFVVTSCLIAIPFYCQKYNFYFATAHVDEIYFGFLFSGLSLSKSATKTVVSLVFLHAEDRLEEVFGLLLGVCAGLVFISILYSWFISHCCLPLEKKCESSNSSSSPAESK